MSDHTTTALARIGPSTMGELRTFAADVAASRFYGFADPAQAFVAISAGMDLGLSHAQSARAWHIIKGKATLSADAMRAVCLASPLCEYFSVVEKTEERCTVRTKRRGDVEQTITWTIEQGRRAGLANGDGWSKYPRAMLLARATGELARQVYPDLLLGIYTSEEMADADRAAPTAPIPVVATVVQTVADPAAPNPAHRWEAVTWEELVELLHVEGIDAGLVDVARVKRGDDALEQGTDEDRAAWLTRALGDARTVAAMRARCGIPAAAADGGAK
jgi:hypothetical protein